jgi:MFS family permease
MHTEEENENAGPTTSSFRPGKLIGLVYLPTFLMAVGVGAVIPVLPLYAKELGASLAGIGLLLALRGAGNLIFDLPAGTFVTRLGFRSSLLTAAVVTAAAAFVAAAFPKVAVLGAANTVLGAMMALWMLARWAYVRSVVAADQRGRALSLLGGVMRIGRFAGPILGGFLAGRFGLRSAFTAQGVITLLAAGLVVFQWNRYEEQKIPLPEDHALKRFFGIIVDHHKTFLSIGLVVIALSLIRAGREVLVPLWGDHVGISVEKIGLIMGLMSGIDMTLFYPVGILMDHKGRKWAAVPCMLLISIGLGLIPLSSGFTGLLLAALVAGFGNGLGSGIVMTMGADHAPEKNPSEFLAVWRLVGDIGGTAAPAIIGVVASAVTLGTAPFIVAGAGVAGAVFMAFGIAEPLHLRVRRAGSAAGTGVVTNPEPPEQQTQSQKQETRGRRDRTDPHR